MTRNVMLAMTENLGFFIGDLDEEKGVLKEVYKLFHQVTDRAKGTIQFGMVDPFLPYSDSSNKPIPEIPLKAFIAHREPQESVRQYYLNLVSGIMVPRNSKGGKIIQAQAGEVIHFTDHKKK